MTENDRICAGRVEAIAASYLRDGRTFSLTRLLGGRTHAVYAVMPHDGRPFVVRLCERQGKKAFEGYIYWDAALKSEGVPTPAILARDLTGNEFQFPYLILAWVKGAEIAECHDKLTVVQLGRLAEDYVRIQAAVARAGGNILGYGGVASPQDRNCYATWPGFLKAYVQNIFARFQANGHQNWAAEVKFFGNIGLERASRALSATRPCAFHEDMTHRNYLIERDKIVAVLDHDEISFGDPLFPIAHMHVGLIMHMRKTTLPQEIVRRLNLSEEGLFRFCLYLIIFYYLEMSYTLRYNVINPRRDPIFTRLETELRETDRKTSGMLAVLSAKEV